MTACGFFGDAGMSRESWLAARAAEVIRNRQGFCSR
jgi:hypothetical protein